MRRIRSERGSITAVEALGIIPVAAIIVGATFQLYLMGQAGVEAESAARLAARELSKGSDPGSAASAGESQANPRFGVQVRTNAGVGGVAEPGTGGVADPGAAKVVATATVPFLGIGIPGLDLHIERSAVMPGKEVGF